MKKQEVLNKIQNTIDFICENNKGSCDNILCNLYDIRSYILENEE